MGWTDKALGWLRREPDENQSEALKEAEADKLDEYYSDAKADSGADLRFGPRMHDSNE